MSHKSENIRELIIRGELKDAINKLPDNPYEKDKILLLQRLFAFEQKRSYGQITKDEEEKELSILSIRIISLDNEVKGKLLFSENTTTIHKNDNHDGISNGIEPHSLSQNSNQPEKLVKSKRNSFRLNLTLSITFSILLLLGGYYLFKEGFLVGDEIINNNSEVNNKSKEQKNPKDEIDHSEKLTDHPLEFSPSEPVDPQNTPQNDEVNIKQRKDSLFTPSKEKPSGSLNTNDRYLAQKEKVKPNQEISNDRDDVDQFGDLGVFSPQDGRSLPYVSRDVVSPDTGEIQLYEYSEVNTSNSQNTIRTTYIKVYCDNPSFSTNPIYVILRVNNFSVKADFLGRGTFIINDLPPAVQINDLAEIEVYTVHQNKLVHKSKDHPIGQLNEVIIK
ncbi:MAG: hypothetical protein AAF824_13495 [Bacteroidota bacterium]